MQLKEPKMHLFCLQIPPRENWFQYVRRVYATAINFPCIIILASGKLLYSKQKMVNTKKPLKKNTRKRG